MATNVYQTIMTMNADLAKFTDEHPPVALLVKKLINYLYAYSKSKNVNLKTTTYECMVPNGEDEIIVVKINRS